MQKAQKLGVLALLTTSGILCNQALADTVLGGYVGAQSWNMATTGSFSQNDSSADFNFDDKRNSSFYAALEHPIPFVPNIKVARTTIDTSGSASLDSDFTFAGETYSVNTDITTQVDLTTTDFILYYEILDNDIASIDVGISGKQISGDFMVADENGTSSARDLSAVIPMGYAKVEVGVPGTGLSVFAEGSALAIDDDSITDYQVGVMYNMVDLIAIDLSLQAGYRSTDIDLNDVDDVFADLKFDGVFLGLELDF